MARLNILALLVTLLAAFALAVDDGTRCSNKNPDVVNAIGQFCQNRNLVSSAPPTSLVPFLASSPSVG